MLHGNSSAASAAARLVPMETRPAAQPVHQAAPSSQTPQLPLSPQSPAVGRIFAVPVFALANGEPWSPPGGTMTLGSSSSFVAGSAGASNVAPAGNALQAAPVEKKSRSGWKRRGELETLQEAP